MIFRKGDQNMKTIELASEICEIRYKCLVVGKVISP